MHGFRDVQGTVKRIGRASRAESANRHTGSSRRGASRGPRRAAASGFSGRSLRTCTGWRTPRAKGPAGDRYDQAGVRASHRSPDRMACRRGRGGGVRPGRTRSRDGGAGRFARFTRFDPIDGRCALVGSARWGGLGECRNSRRARRVERVGRGPRPTRRAARAAPPRWRRSAVVHLPVGEGAQRMVRSLSRRLRRRRRGAIRTPLRDARSARPRDRPRVDHLSELPGGDRL